jgi:hypothetical protein
MEIKNKEKKKIKKRLKDQISFFFKPFEDRYQFEDIFQYLEKKELKK